MKLPDRIFVIEQFESDEDGLRYGEWANRQDYAEEKAYFAGVDAPTEYIPISPAREHAEEYKLKLEEALTIIDHLSCDDIPEACVIEKAESIRLWNKEMNKLATIEAEEKEVTK